ncbi:MAG: sarcosine oxidase [Actinomycetota bacterium]|jgi:glycine/D-amino acid oxidase-like deaminating enzyme|nr:sarcosine oxidase [Actinomycetota bacterium]
MRCIVVGAGAWGLPAAAELAGRGHEVVLVDRYGIANPLSSSPGPTRLWRLTHPDAVRIRLARRSVEAMERLASRSGQTVFLRRGLLWRDGPAPLAAVADALAAEDVLHVQVAAADVASYFPGLRVDGRDAIWQADAGPVLAAASMTAQATLFEAAGGTTVIGAEVSDVEVRSSGVRLTCRDGSLLDADSVVLAPGPGAGRLLSRVGVDLPLRPVLEQVVHVGGPGDSDLPCLYDGPADDQPAMYAMPTPGLGYKLGLDRQLRDLVEGDTDRTPDPALTAMAVDRARRDLTAIRPEVVDAQVCSWTESPDHRFVVDVLPGGITIACGDSGEGFKFSALMGLVLADLATGANADPDVASFGLHRFAGPVESAASHVLGH